MHLTGIFTYPVKSLSGIEMDTAHAGLRGLAGDRRWMLVDDRGVFVSQRSEPRMALVRTRLAESGLVLSAPHHDDLSLTVPADDAPRLEVEIWDDRVPALAGAEEAADWMSAFLSRPVRFVWMPDDTRRPVEPEYASADDLVGFADGYPYLLTSEASLADLNDRLAAPLEMRRFRPNLVVAGCAPFAEDGWRRLRIGEVAFRCVKPCARCTVTTVDPDTAETGREPLRTLATFRARDGGVDFGMNLIADGEGRLRRGDPVEILA